MQETLAEADWNHSISRATCWLLRSSISFTQKGGKMFNYFLQHLIREENWCCQHVKRKILSPSCWVLDTGERMSLWWDRQSIWKYGRREKKAYLIYHMTLHVWLERRDEVGPKDLAECEKAHFQKWCKSILTTCWNTWRWVLYCAAGRTGIKIKWKTKSQNSINKQVHREWMIQMCC